MKKFLRILFVFIAALCISLINEWQKSENKISKVSVPRKQSEISDSRTYKVVKVIDGDTIYLDNPINPIKVRMIGIDAPEARENEKALRDSQKSRKSIKAITELGAKSARYLESLISKGQKVRLVFDFTKFDKFGRTLAYVYSEKGEFLNLKLLENGYVYAYPVSPNLRFEREFNQAAQRAREGKKGLWAQN